MMQISKMPGVNGLARHLAINSTEANIGGHSQVLNSIAQARAQLRSRGSPFARGANEFRSASPIHEVIARHNILGKTQYQQNPSAYLLLYVNAVVLFLIIPFFVPVDLRTRASIRTEAANDVNLWATSGEVAGAASAGKTKWEVHGMERLPGAGLLPKLQDAPAPATEEEHRHHHKRKKKRKRNKRKLKSLAKKRAR